MDKCPICDGKLKKTLINETMFGVYLGKFPGWECTKCGESYTESETTQKIEDAAKAKGIWGLGAKTKITKTGNSVAIRISKKMVDYLDLKIGNEAYVHPEGKRLIIEV